MEIFYVCMLSVKSLSFFFFFQSCFQKNQIMKELEEQKQKLLRAEQNLQAIQSKEHDVRKKMEVGLIKRYILSERNATQRTLFFILAAFAATVVNSM